MLRPAVVVVLLALVGCDPVNSPLLCNGYDSPILITAKLNGGAEKMVTSLSKGECRSEILATRIHGSNSSRVIDFNNLIGELIVTNGTGSILATYSEEMNKRILPGRSFAPHYLFTGKGIFLVPQEYENSWRENISAIERYVEGSFQN